MCILNQQWSETNIINSMPIREFLYALSFPVCYYQHAPPRARQYNYLALSSIALKAILYFTSRLMVNLYSLIALNYLSFPHPPFSLHILSLNDAQKLEVSSEITKVFQLWMQIILKAGSGRQMLRFKRKETLRVPQKSSWRSDGQGHKA